MSKVNAIVDIVNIDAKKIEFNFNTRIQIIKCINFNIEHEKLTLMQIDNFMLI